MYIKRKLEGEILKYLAAPEILAIVGPRQAGKTTLLKNIYAQLEKAVFLSFEDRETLELFNEDIKSFAKKYSSYRYIFIDEFQYAKNGGKNLKFLYDSYDGIKLIISGSSAVDLTIRAIKFLVGRVFVFNLYQLDFAEYLAFKDPGLTKVYQELKNKFDLIGNRFSEIKISATINKQLNEILEDFIIWGGYPRVATAVSAEEKKTVLKNIYNTYFLRDIKDILGLVDDFKLSKLIKALAVQTGQLMEYNELSRLSDYDYLTLKKYLNILEKTFICRQISPFYKNKRTEITKNPKPYFFDTGLRNYVLNNFNDLSSRTDKGFLYENFVFNQLLKAEAPINFWRTKSKAEVDFVTQINNQALPIESKSELGQATTTRAFNSFLEQYQPQEAIVLNESLVGARQRGETKIHFLPHWLI